MFEAIKSEGARLSGWKTLTLGVGQTAEGVRIPVGPVLVPLSVWKARRVELIHREYEHGWPLGVWIAANESADEIAPDVDDFAVIAVEFDGPPGEAAYAVADALREEYGYSGAIYAIGRAAGHRSFLDAADAHVPVRAAFSTEGPLLSATKHGAALRSVRLPLTA